MVSIQNIKGRKSGSVIRNNGKNKKQSSWFKPSGRVLCRLTGLRKNSKLVPFFFFFFFLCVLSFLSEVQSRCWKSGKDVVFWVSRFLVVLMSKCVRKRVFFFSFLIQNSLILWVGVWTSGGSSLSAGIFAAPVSHWLGWLVIPHVWMLLWLADLMFCTGWCPNCYCCLAKLLWACTHMVPVCIQLNQCCLACLCDFDEQNQHFWTVLGKYFLFLWLAEKQFFIFVVE